MIDPALPECIEFSELEYVSQSFEKAIHQNYDLYFFVKTNEDEQPKVVLILPTKQRIELLFGPTATIGIKNSKLCYNSSNLIKINYEQIPCTSSPDGKHQWQEKFSSKNLRVLTCINCGHTRLLATAELIKQWEDSGFIL